ncbi:MAG: c-type cytochrome [Rubrivivax sp.]
MKSALPAALLCTALLAGTPAWASPELAQARICMGCHGVADKKLGPTFRDIANRYAGQRDAAARLADRIRNGSMGAWGQVPMPANPKVTPDEARQLAAWVLTLK